MESRRCVDFGSFVFNNEILGELVKKLGWCQTIEILYDPVVVDYVEMGCRECNCHEIIVFLFSCMIWIGCSLFGTYESRGS
ncbi:hypothetical protein IMSAGC016_01602 [Muribaculaceae bacterium]|nr:hypothetical protein IMSAGC016_01602 [Muribaculaceae bacterium]